MATERISSDEWERLLPALAKCSMVTINIAREVLVDGRKQVDVCEKYSRSKQTVNAAISRVRKLFAEVISEPDMEFVEVWLPREEAQRVLQMASKYAVNKK
ncbi:ArdK family transcriptional regulator (plasmid) [Pectobacterium parmentieri]|uniref:TrfB-related DNA-binding protein n=1 Tax=Pectobacterium parmentieri TaxID=1905730 RepID=UPI000F8E5A49|nr:TrfB-related DNA-binding protein [Pectobacterium parmentieri]AZS59275.1 ArdK family transcriptional regulator [Pectobacterium parmentieri]